MKKILLKYGVTSGLMLAVWLFIAFSNVDKGSENMAMGEIVGFSVMFLAFGVTMALALLALKKESGTVKISKGILLCLGIAGIASLFYLISWAVIYNYIFTDFKDWYLASLEQQQKAGKISADSLKQTTDMMSNYDNPLVFTAYTLMEIFPVGAILSLIIAPAFSLVTRKKEDQKST